MTRRSVFSLAVALGTLVVSVTASHAAELKVFASVALQSALEQLVPAYETKPATSFKSPTTSPQGS